MNKYLKAFSFLAWFGVVINLLFAVPTFFAPDVLIDRLGIDEGFETVWLRNAGLLIFLVTFYTIAVALAPAKYPAVSWIVVGGRFLAGVYWFQVTFFGDQLNTTTDGSSFWPFLAGDIILSTLQAVFLNLGLPPEGRISVENAGKLGQRLARLPAHAAEKSDAESQERER